MKMKKNLIATLAVVSAAVTLADLPFWGEDNGGGTNVVATASAVSSVAKPVAVRTVSVSLTDLFEFSSYPRGLLIYIK